MKNLFLFLFVIILLGSPLFAQETSSIVGTVSDTSGALIPEATVTAINIATQFRRTISTNERGEYVASALPTGNYVLTAEKAGFQKLERSGITLTTASTLSVDLKLVIGSENQTVTVTAVASLLRSQSGVVSSLVDSKQIVDLPLASRNFTDLVLLTPGAHTGSSSNLAEGGSAYSIRGGANFSVNGSIAAANSYLIDGIYDRNLWLNTLVMVPVVDAIQEYRVMTSNFTAEYGEAAGAVTSVTTKSGSNSFHGSAWEFVRNDKFNANTFFANRAGIKRPAYRRNTFGATVGGPIISNKTFFFGDYQGIRMTSPQIYTSTIPTLTQRQMVQTGNFSGLATPIYNPYSTSTVGGATTRAAFPGNQIPVGLLDPAAVKLIALLPTPTTAGATNNFTYTPALTQKTDQFDVRIDQNLGSSDRLFFKYSFDKTTQVTPGTIPSPANASIPIGPYLSTNGTGSGTSTPLFTQSGTLGYTKVLSASTLIEAHAAVVRWNADVTPLGSAYASATALGIPGINYNNRSGGLPGFTISGFQALAIHRAIRKTVTSLPSSTTAALQRRTVRTLSKLAHCFFVTSSMDTQLSRLVAPTISMASSRGRLEVPVQHQHSRTLPSERRTLRTVIFSTVPSACASSSSHPSFRIPGEYRIALPWNMALAMKSVHPRTMSTITGRTSMSRQVSCGWLV